MLLAVTPRCAYALECLVADPHTLLTCSRSHPDALWILLQYTQLPGSLSAVGLAYFLMLLAGCRCTSARTHITCGPTNKGFPCYSHCSPFCYAVLPSVSVCGMPTPVRLTYDARQGVLAVWAARTGGNQCRGVLDTCLRAALADIHLKSTAPS